MRRRPRLSWPICVKLMTALERVPAAIRTAGNVVKIEHALDVKRDVLPALDEGQVPARIVDLGKVNALAVVDGHGVFLRRLGDGPDKSKPAI